MEFTSVPQSLGVSGSSTHVTRSVAVAAIVMALLTLAWRFLTFTGFSNDHYVHVALAQQLLLGERPVRDFLDPGLPLMYFVSAGAHILGGPHLWTEFAVVCVAFALAAAFTLATAHRLAASVGIAILVTAIEILAYPRSYSYPKVLAYAVAASAMLAVAERPDRRRIALTAMIIALAFLFRHDHGLYIGVASAVCVGLACRAHGWRTTARCVAALTSATVVLLLPWCLFVALNGGLVPYLRAGIEFSRAEAVATRLRSWPRFQLVPGEPLLGLERASRPLATVEWLPDTSDALRQTLERRYALEHVRDDGRSSMYYLQDTSDQLIRALADDPHVSGTSGLGRSQWPWWRELLADASPLRLAPALHGEDNAEAWLFWLFWALPVLCGALAGIGLARGRERWSGELAVVAALVVLAALVNAGFLRDTLRARLPDAIVPAALLGAWALGRCWSGRWRRPALQVLVRVGTIVIVAVTVAALATVADLPEQLERAGLGDGDDVWTRAGRVSELLARTHRQDLAPPSRTAKVLMPFFDYVDRCTSRTDRLILTSLVPEVLVLAERGFAGGTLAFVGSYLSEQDQMRTIERLQEQSVPFVLVTDGYESFRNRFGQLDAYMVTEFEPMADISGEGTEVRVLVKRDRSPVRIDPSTGWRCFR